MKIIDVYTDGATIGRNGKLGTVKEVGLGLYIPELEHADCKRVKGISNNEAEFKALIWGMEVAIKEGLKNVKFNSDSKIIINRANGSRPKKKYWNERMNAFQDKVFELKKHFDNISFKWIPRENNITADLYSNMAKDLD